MNEGRRSGEANTALALFVLLLISCLSAGAQDVVAKAMQDELARSMGQLQVQGMQKPYFVAYRADDIDDTKVSASLGSLTEETPSHRRTLGVEVRVGDYKLDNSNFFSARSFAGTARFANSLVEAPLDDDYAEIRRRLWLATDAQYKSALEDYSSKKAALEQRKQGEDAQDFSKEPAAHLSETAAQSKVDLAALEQLARTISAVFRQMPEIYTSSVQLECHDVYTRYVNSEGTSFTRWQPFLHLGVSAGTQSSDGLPINESFDVYLRSAAELPREGELVERARQMGERVARLREASYMERYNGPLLFEDEAAAEIFAQIFAPALVAVPAPVSDDPRFEMVFDQFASQLTGGGSLLQKIGGRVLPEFLSVADNPQQDAYNGITLPGTWKIDDDGVMTRPTKLVEKGTLKALLTTRAPAPPLEHSSGSRRGWGPAPAALTVSADKTMTHDEMRQELLRRVKDRGLAYGIVVRTVGGGGLTGILRMFASMATNPGSMATNSLTEGYKLFPDGHEETIRGAELSGMTTASFRDIAAAGDRPVLFNALFIPKFNALFSMGLSGASDMPVTSYIVPSLLFEEATLVKTSGSRPNPPATKSPLAER